MGATMGTENLKIIDFDSIRGKAASGIVADLRTLALRHLSQQFKNLLAFSDDELFKLSGIAKTNQQQAQYFEAMRYLRIEANTATAQFEAAVLKRFDEFWKPGAKRGAKPESALASSLSEDDLTLVDNAALEETLAVSGMVEKGKNLFQRDLHALNARFAKMAGLDEIQADDNPVGPHCLCLALSDALQPLTLDLSIKLLIYKLYDQIALMTWGELYAELNTLLINEGILPHLPSSYKRAPMGAMARPNGPVADSPAQSWQADGPDEGHKVFMEAFSAMENLMGSWRLRMGIPSLYPTNYRGPTFASGEVLNALSVLQHPQMLGNIPTVEGVKVFLQQHLRKAAPSDDGRPLARREEDTIDMVSLLFEFILADNNLPDPVKTLISRLQIPVIKVAILEKSLLGRKNHPVRLLLNALAQAGIGLDVTEGIADTPVFRRIESVVNRILDEFDQNVNLFSDLLDEFTAFVQKENQRSGVAEERTRQVTQSKEHVQIAKHKVAYEIASRLQGKSTPTAVRSFLFNTWKDVLVLGYLRRDKSPGDWENSLVVMDRLIWSVTTPVEAGTRMNLVNAIPPLLKSIKVGLEVLSLDPQAVTSILKDLRACHIIRLSHLPGGEEELAGQRAGAAEQLAAQEQAKVEIRDPELAKAIVDIRANLPDVENFSIADLASLPDGIEGLQTEDGDNAIDEAVMARARNLSVGEWVELHEGKHRVRAKLSWKSQLTQTYVFVNRRGSKVAEIALPDLAKRLNEDTARVIEGGDVPLMDRALNGLLGKLRGQPPEEAVLNAV
jgi:hypothetical protein